MVSLSATVVAAVVGLPSGAALAICRFPGRRLLILLANAFLGLPPVVVGLALYLLLSRSGPLGVLAFLFTPGAMVIAQALLATPIITALTHRAIEEPWQEYGGALRVDGATRLRSIRMLPEPVQIGVAERLHIVRLKHRGAVRQPAFLEDQRVDAGRAHAEYIPVRVDATPLGPAGQHQDDAGRRTRRLVRMSHHQHKIGRFEHRSEHLATGDSVPAIGPPRPRLQRPLAYQRSGDRLGEVAGD